MRFAVSVAFAIALCAGGSAAQAEGPGGPERESVLLDYRVPQACPDEHSFVEGVLARTQRGRFTTEPSARRRFSIDVKRKGDGFVGTLVIVQGEERSRREIASARCTDVIGAFVFFVSIALDPARGSDVRPDGAESTSDGVETSPDQAGEMPAPETHRDVPEMPAAQAPRRLPPRRALVATKAKPPRSASFHLSFGSGALAATGIAESAIGSVLPTVDLASDAFGLSPSVRGSVLWGASTSQATPPAGELTVGLRALGLSGCVLRLPVVSASASVRLCALVEGGVLLVRPFGHSRPTTPDRLWIAAGPLVRGEIELLPKRLSVGVDAALAMPLEREDVHVRSGPTVALVQSVGARFSAVVLLRAF